MSRDFWNRMPLQIVACTLVLVAFVAFGQSVKRNYLPGIDFSKYHTYAWATTKPHPNPDVDAEIRRLIDSQLATKGLTKTDNQPDLTIDYQIAMSQDERWSSFRYNEIETQTPKLETVHAGTLGIDIEDVARKRLVWTGRATKAIDPNATTQTKQMYLEKAIKKLLQGYPPK
jgi:hypothetical protein